MPRALTLFTPGWIILASPHAPAAFAYHTDTGTNPNSRHNPNVPDIIPETLPRMTSWPDFPFIVVDGGFPDSPPAPVAFDVRKKIGQTVYQKTFPFIGDHIKSTTPVLQRRRMVIPYDPRTTAQLELRARFGRAVQHWKALTPAERQAYNARARARKPWLEGLNLFIREYCRDHAPAEFADDAEYLRTHGSLPPLE